MYLTMKYKSVLLSLGLGVAMTLSASADNETATTTSQTNDSASVDTVCHYVVHADWLSEEEQKAYHEYHMKHDPSYRRLMRKIDRLIKRDQRKKAKQDKSCDKGRNLNQR